MKNGEELFIEGRLDEAYEKLLKEAEAGSGRALYLLGEYAKHDWLSPVDWRSAKEYAKRGAETGDLLSQLNVGYAMRMGTKKQQAYMDRLIPRVEAAAEAGDILAMYEMADLYAQGMFVPTDVKKRWYWNAKAAEAGFWLGRTRMGSLYLWADGDMADLQDEAKGIFLLDAMVKEGTKASGVAAHLLADHYFYTGDFAQSFRYSRISADWGNSFGYFFLGRHYMIGEAVPEDFHEAIRWLRKSYDFHYETCAEAALYIGNCYSFLLKPKTAVTWYKKAANRGRDEAWLELGICYESGNGVEQDMDEAMHCYEVAYRRKRAASLDAAYHLARNLEGTDNDRAESLALEAAEGNHLDAMFFLMYFYCEAKKDYRASIRWAETFFEKAGERDIRRGFAANHLAGMYNAVSDPDKALQWAKTGATIGTPAAMYHYAKMLYERSASEEDIQEARTWFGKFMDVATDEDLPEGEKKEILGDACNLAGMCCIQMNDIDEAGEWFEKSLAYDNPFGMMNLGGLYMARNEEGDQETALSWLLKAQQIGKDIFDDHSKGIIASQISTCYRNMNDEKNSFYWANQSASYRCEAGMINLGMHYAHGIGTLKDTKKAAEWLTAAYNLQGLSAGETANYLALMYAEEGDLEQAALWFRRGADLGNGWAMNNLASHYEAGDLSQDGTPDYESALALYRKAAETDEDVIQEAQEGIARCEAALSEPADQGNEPTTDLKDIYMPWHATMKWGSND